MLLLFDEAAELPLVTSDFRVWPGRARLAVCRMCGLVQKPVDDAWLEEAEKVYAEYAMYEHASQGAEQCVIAGDAFQTRSTAVLSAAFETFGAADRGKLLDYGCGNGATLRAAAQLLPTWRHAGYEPNVKDPDAITSIPGVDALYDEVLPEHGPFDIVTMMHVLEHIPNPASCLERLASLLVTAGAIVIQVPYYARNPFELCIIDHCSHFSPSTLRAVCERAGLKVVFNSISVVRKEITVIATRADHALPACDGDAATRDGDEAADVRRSIGWLAALAKDAVGAAARRQGPFGVFGTSIAASWILSHLGDNVSFFVDEDPNRAGNSFMNRPVYAPADAPSEGECLIVLPSDIASEIAKRLETAPVQWRLPPQPVEF